MVIGNFEGDDMLCSFKFSHPPAWNIYHSISFSFSFSLFLHTITLHAITVKEQTPLLSSVF